MNKIKAFDTLTSYLVTELAGYDYALSIHQKRKDAEVSNKVEYITGRIDAIKAALEVAKTLE
jgi:hypothetical protein